MIFPCSLLTYIGIFPYIYTSTQCIVEYRRSELEILFRFLKITRGIVHQNSALRKYCFWNSVKGTASHKLTLFKSSLSLSLRLVRQSIKIKLIKGTVRKLHIKFSAFTTHLPLKVLAFSKAH